MSELWPLMRECVCVFVLLLATTLRVQIRTGFRLAGQRLAEGHELKVSPNMCITLKPSRLRNSINTSEHVGNNEKSHKCSIWSLLKHFDNCFRSVCCVVVLPLTPLWLAFHLELPSVSSSRLLNWVWDSGHPLSRSLNLPLRRRGQKQSTQEVNLCPLHMWGNLKILTGWKMLTNSTHLRFYNSGN